MWKNKKPTAVEKTIIFVFSLIFIGPLWFHLKWLINCRNDNQWFYNSIWNELKSGPLYMYIVPIYISMIHDVFNYNLWDTSECRKRMIISFFAIFAVFYEFFRVQFGKSLVDNTFIIIQIVSCVMILFITTEIKHIIHIKTTRNKTYKKV